MEMIEFEEKYNMKELDEIKEPEDGQIVYNETDESYFIYKNEKWKISRCSSYNSKNLGLGATK